MRMTAGTATFLLALVATLFAASSPAVLAQPAPQPPPNPYEVERSWPPYFLEHQTLFTEKAGTYKAGKYPVWTVHVPGGWIGNSTIIEGDDGLIVYDTSVNVEAGAFIASEIRKISDKPIKAIFYSHHHTDHYNGTSALVTPEQVADGSVRIYAWDNFEEEIANEFGAIMPRQLMGVFYYGPDLLPPEEKHYHGCCAPRVLGGKSGYIPPTDTFSEDTELEIAGVRMKVFYTGGEAISEFGLYLPDFDMVLIADEFFYALANVHSIRGSKPRLPENYMKALDTVREIKPEWLLGSHIMPIQGREDIQRYVTTSHDAIQYLWDQGIRYINKGYTPAELQQQFRELPPYLDIAPYTRPMYGTPWIIAPEIYTGWVSWFSGDATDLSPTEPVTRARRYVDMMGGRDKVLATARQAFADGDGQFAAELTQLLVRIDNNDWDARHLKAASLRQRGYQEINTIARAWYLNGANELDGKVNPAGLMKLGMQSFQAGLSGGELLESWRYQVDPDKAGDSRVVLGFEFTDSGDSYAVELRNSILEIRPGPLPAGMPAVRLTTQQLQDVLAGKPAPADAGDTDTLAGILAFLDRDNQGFYMHVR
ncbi:MAG: alkyl sulfatase dimerization domain-containing protein [Halieaceae bacterium]|nr:alkyl sulfatase dimerization domain-containing protein [Halieaceae bacterium]